MLIAFAGCDGAGKSTQVKCVRRWLESAGVRAQIIDRWEILDPEKFPECRFLRATTRDEVRVCNSEMEGPSRALFLFWTMSVAAQRMDRSDPDCVYLLDSYWMKHAAAELELGCDPAWIEATARAFPPADLTLYLDVSPEEALRRKSELTPYECGRDVRLDPRDFLAHQGKLRERLRGWAHEWGWTIVSSMQDPVQVAEEVRAHVQARLLTPLARAGAAGSAKA